MSWLINHKKTMFKSHFDRKNFLIALGGNPDFTTHLSKHPNQLGTKANSEQRLKAVSAVDHGAG